MQKQINNLKRKLSLVTGSGLIHSIDDNQQAQTSFLPSEPVDKTPIIQHYGFTSRPLKGAKGVGICNGNREDLVIIATDDMRYRLSIQNGEVALYTDEGDHIHLKRDNKIEIKSGKLSIIQKDSKDDLVQIVHDVIEALELAVTPTTLGPQALSTQSVFAAAKLKIKNFMEQSDA